MFDLDDLQDLVSCGRGGHLALSTQPLSEGRKSFLKKIRNIKAATPRQNLDYFVTTKKHLVYLALYRFPGLNCPGGRSLFSLKDVVPGWNKCRRSLAVCKKKKTKEWTHNMQQLQDETCWLIQPWKRDFRYNCPFYSLRLNIVLAAPSDLPCFSFPRAEARHDVRHS